MDVSLHSTRVQRFAYSLAAVAGKRIPGQWAAGPLGGSRWVSGNWALKSSLACLECPLSPGRAPAPGELARAKRLHSSTGRPDSSATLQTSLQPRLRAKTARRRGAPSPVPGSQTCRFHDSCLLGNFATSKLLRLRDAGSARLRARAGLGFGAAEFGVSVALDERRPPSSAPRAEIWRLLGAWGPGDRHFGIP